MKITSGTWRYSKENNCITTSPKGLIEGGKIICMINEKVSFELTGKEADSNGILLESAPEMGEIIISLENDNNSIPEPIWNQILELKSKLNKILP